jgi:phage-related protein
VPKPVNWVGSSRFALRNFPEEARRQAGNELWLVQEGKMPTDFKPLPDIGPGAMEIRIHKPHEHRLIYVARFPAVYVLNAFEKKSQQMPQKEMSVARSNYAKMQQERTKS